MNKEWMEGNEARVSNNLRFADDIGLMAEMLNQAQLLVDRVDQVSWKYGKEINETKTEWMLFSAQPEQIVRIEEENRGRTTTQRKMITKRMELQTAIVRRKSEREQQLS